MFTKENTKQIKGVAIILMLAHHLFAFPDKVPFGVSLSTDIIISEKELVQLIGEFCKICVSIYMFMGGYGLYKKAVKQGDEDVIQNSLAKNISRLYMAYWKIFLIFVPIAILFFNNQGAYCVEESICFRYANVTLKDLLMNFVGLSYTLNSEWWFFGYYLFALFLGWVFIELFRNKRNLYIEICTVIVWSIFLTRVFPILPFKEGMDLLWSNIWYKYICLGSEYSILFFVGIIYAKYKIFEGWEKNVQVLKRIEAILAALFVIGLLVYTRVFFTDVAFDIVVVPAFIFACTVIIGKNKWLAKLFGYLGEHSTNIWLVHSFYCFYFAPVVRIVYASNNAIVALLVLLALSLVTSILLNAFWKLIGTGRMKLFYRA